MALSGLGMGFSSIASYLCCRVRSRECVPKPSCIMEGFQNTALSGLHMGFAVQQRDHATAKPYLTLSLGNAQVFKVVDAKRTVTWHFYATKIMPIGLFMAATLHFGNLVYLYLTVSFIQMLKVIPCPVLRAQIPVVTLSVFLSHVLALLNKRLDRRHALKSQRTADRSVQSVCQGREPQTTPRCAAVLLGPSSNVPADATGWEQTSSSAARATARRRTSCRSMLPFARQAFTPIVTMVALFVAGLETPAWRLIGAVGAIAVGTAAASYGCVSDPLGVSNTPRLFICRTRRRHCYRHRRRLLRAHLEAVRLTSPKSTPLQTKNCLKVLLFKPKIAPAPCNPGPCCAHTRCVGRCCGELL